MQRDRPASSTRKREHWASPFGFVLAALGSAVGIGNVWRFSYLVGANGGGAFLLLYLAVLVLVAVPLLIAELAIGKRAQCAPQLALLHLPRPASPRMDRGLQGLGWLQVLAPAVALSYYSVLTGWVLRYAFVYGAEALAGAPPLQGAAAFRDFIADPVAPLVWHALTMAVCFAVVVRGVRRGIETANRVMMPALALVLLALALEALRMPGAEAGLRFLFVPDWSQLLNPRVVIAALGQAFFSIGIACGSMLTYGSYLARDARLPALAARVVIGDTLFAVVAGIVVFSAVFTLGARPDQGPTLAFVTLPSLFARIPGGAWVGLAFFVLLGLAALSSAVSLLEVPVSALVDATGWSRRRLVLPVALGCFALGVPPALGYGPPSWLRIPFGGDGSMALLDALDALLSNLLLPINGIVIAWVVGRLWRRADVLVASGFGPTCGRLWLGLLRWVVPPLIVLVLIGGFMRG